MATEAPNYHYRENTGHVTEVRGPAVVAVREDVDINFANDHEYGPLQLNNQGRLKVDATSTTQSLSEWFEDTPHTTGDTGVFVLAVRNDDNAAMTTTNGDYSPFAVNVNGALAISDGGNSITVDGTVTADTNFDYAEDSAHSSGNVGAFVLAVRNDANAVLTNTDLDYSPIAVNSTGAIKVDVTATQKPTYSACAIVQPTPSATDVFTITGVNGSNVKIQSINVTGEQEVARNIEIRLIKRSTPNTGGTSLVITGVPFNSNDAAATAVVRRYSSNPTLGTTIGTVRDGLFAIAPVINTIGNQGAVFTFDEGRGKEMCLISDSEVLAVNLAQATISNGVLYINIQWTEEPL